jgi:DNA polymerase-3 subunit delta
MARAHETTLPGCILVAGDAFLVNEAVDLITAFLSKDQAGGANMAVLDGRSTPMGDIIEQATTFSFFPGRKVIALKQAPIFSTRPGAGEIVYSEKDFLRLSDLVEKGMPEDNFLIMTALSLDRRRKIYKTLDTSGLIIDCTVAQGARKADLDEQRAVLRDIAKKVLGRSGKTMDQAGFSTLSDLTGFDPGLFARNLEKLVAYSGTRQAIVQADVKAVIPRDKKDPIFSLTNALMEKNAGKALFYLSSLFADGFHPLQILKAFENLVRKLVLVKAFAEDFARSHPEVRLDRLHFNTFKQKVLPAIISHDDMVKNQTQAFQTTLADTGASDGKKKEKTAAPVDLLLAPNPKSPYPVFQSFDKSAEFSLNELCAALIALGDLDFALKSSSMEAKVGIENFVIIFCQKGGWLHAAENQNNCNHF